MASGDVYQLSVDQTLHGVRFRNVFHYQTGADADDDKSNEQAIILAFEAQVSVPAWAPAVSSDLAFQCYSCRKVSPSAGSEFVAAAIGATSGGAAADALPANQVVLITRKTATGGRGKTQSRSYISGLSKQYEVDGNISNEWQDELEALATALDNTLTQVAPGTGQWAPCLPPSVDKDDNPLAAMQFVEGLHNVRGNLRKLRSRTALLCGSS